MDETSGQADQPDSCNREIIAGMDEKRCLFTDSANENPLLFSAPFKGPRNNSPGFQPWAQTTDRLFKLAQGFNPGHESVEVRTSRMNFFHYIPEGDPNE